jgi:hypothetical protein
MKSDVKILTHNPSVARTLHVTPISEYAYTEAANSGSNHAGRGPQPRKDS